jgi:hypothetical protein
MTPPLPGVYSASHRVRSGSTRRLIWAYNRSCPLVDKESGLTAAKIAQAIALPLPFVAKLNQRLFTASSLPAALVGRIADAIGRSTDEVIGFLAGPPTLARSAAYRSDDAPVVGEQEDFQAALLADDSVSAEAKATYSTNG